MQRLSANLGTWQEIIQLCDWSLCKWSWLEGKEEIPSQQPKCVDGVYWFLCPEKVWTYFQNVLQFVNYDPWINRHFWRLLVGTLSDFRLSDFRRYRITENRQNFDKTSSCVQHCPSGREWNLLGHWQCHIAHSMSKFCSILQRIDMKNGHTENVMEYSVQYRITALEQ